jgi:protein ImuA
MHADLAQLRRQVAAIETKGRTASVLTTGAPGVDALLPGGGLAFAALHEALPAAPFDEAAAAAFLIALAVRAGDIRAGQVVWIVPPAAFDMGLLYGPGLAAFGLDPARVTILAAPDETAALWAGEEALACPGAAAVILIQSKPLGLSASRRLQLAAERGGGLGLLLARHDAAGAGLARTRWRIAARASAAPDWALGLPGLRPPGAPAWRADLMRVSGARPATFDLEWRHASRCLCVPAVLGHAAPLTARRFA